jgi:predicted nucleotidyltransferase
MSIIEIKMKKPLTQIQIGQTLEHLLTNQVEFAYLLGSAGTERFHTESDIDLAIFWKKEPKLPELSSISNELTEKLNDHDVDLISLNTADLIFSRQVLETGRLLFCNSPGLHLQWKADQLSRYPDFKFTRAIIEKNILNRKKYVGT